MRERERFWAKVADPNEDGCMEWQAARKRDGHGQFSFEGTNQLAHRVRFYFEHGRWPSPYCLHTCGNAACVNIEHLYEGTPADNMRDAVEDGLLPEANRRKWDEDYVPLSAPAEMDCNWCGSTVTRTRRHVVRDLPVYCGTSCVQKNRWARARARDDYEDLTDKRTA